MPHSVKLSKFILSARKITHLISFVPRDGLIPQHYRLVQSVKAVESCKKLGNAGVKVVDQIIFERDAEKVTGELADLARNEAGLMGGDTIVPISEIVDGRRSFGVYQCFQSKRMN